MYKGSNILDYFTYMAVPIRDLHDEIQKSYNSYYFKDSEKVTESINHIKNFESAEFAYFSYADFENYIYDILKPNQFYGYLRVSITNSGLVIGSGYSLTTSYKGVFTFGFDFSMYYLDNSEDSRLNFYRITSHDFPTGSNTLIIGLDKETYKHFTGNAKPSEILQYAQNAYKELTNK